VIDSKVLSEFAKEHLRDLNYEQRIKIWRTGCSNCPHMSLEVTDKYFGKTTKLSSTNELAEILSANRDWTVSRGCTYADQYVNLFEITSATCKLWRDETCEDNIEEAYEPTPAQRKEIEELEYA